jgi:hypothetical protein
MISRGQMYRQLYYGGGIGSLDAGAPSIKYTGNIDSQMASAPDPMDALNDLAMQLFGKPLDMLTPSERQALDEYNSGMMAVGGRVNYGIGSSIKKAIKKVGNVIKDVADPVAQALAVIPNPYQPYAQAYTGIRSTGIGGDYQGLQIGGYTPGAYGGQYGLNPFSSGNIFQTQGIIPTFDATNPNTGESIFNPDGTLKSGSTTSSSRGFFEKAKKAAEGIKSVYDQVSDSVSGPKKYPNISTTEKKQKSIPDTVKDILLDTALGKNRDDGLRRGTSAYLAKKAYDDQVRYNELLKKQYEDYIAATGAARTKFADKSKLRGYEVTGVPRSARDVVRAPVMGGGIMNTRMGYGSGSEDLEYKGWKKIFLKSNDAAESHPRHSEFIKRFAEETMGQDRSPEVRIKKAVGGDLSEPMSSFELQNLRAGPDWYIKRIEALMYEYDMDYDTAAEIAFDSDKYFELMPDGLAKGGRPGYALGDTATMAAQAEGLPLRNNQAGITELDLRDSGGFIPPVGIKEKADDIPAMLSNNEFVFTADAVRGMGDGDVDVGAQRMYDIMKKLEKGGRV